MALKSTKKVRAEARGHMKTSTFGRRTWILRVDVGIGIGICRQHKPVQPLTEINPEADPDPARTLGPKSKSLISMSDVPVTRSLRGRPWRRIVPAFVVSSLFGFRRRVRDAELFEVRLVLCGIEVILAHLRPEFFHQLFIQPDGRLVVVADERLVPGFL